MYATVNCKVPAPIAKSALQQLYYSLYEAKRHLCFLISGYTNKTAVYTHRPKNNVNGQI